MDIGAILFVLALLLLVGSYVARPIFEPTPKSAAGGSPQLSRLQARRERLLDAIQELDTDHELGKVLDEDYREQRRRLAAEGAAVLRQLDQLNDGVQPGGEQLASTALAEPERQPAAAAVPTGTAGQPAHQGQLERELEARVTAIKGKRAAGYCPACGSPVMAGDRFCSNCGTVLQE